MTVETHAFQAEVGKLLDIVARSLYSHKEIFLRELVSNASDACDKLRYEALTQPGLIDGDAAFKISLTVDADARTLTVADNGIGMTRDDLSELLGTIARSGTQAFVDNLTGDKDADVSLIGQFGVGFYSAFMVADKVDVVTRRAGEAAACKWSSDGRGEYTLEETARDGHGTDIVLHLSEGEDEFLEPMRLETIIKTYSDHIGIPIDLADPEAEGGARTLNTASALWTRDKKDITDEQYTEFYHHVSHAFDTPWLTLHNKVEGVVSYTNLLFVPTTRPYDLFNAERDCKVRLYVNRVFITEDKTELVPGYLRFVRGIVDSEDLPLNISRELLQQNPQLAKIRSGLTKRVLSELKKKAEKDAEAYATFWEAFGPVVKEGLYEDHANKDTLLELVRFKSSTQDGWTSLADYVERMKDGQDAIYYISGEDAARVLASPQLEGFRAKGIEVLLMTDPVDEFWLPAVGTYQEKAIKSATRGGADLTKISGKDQDDAESDTQKTADEPADLDTLVAALKLALGERVKDVRRSERLTESPVCLVADDGDMDMNLERLLKRHNQLGDAELTPRILEINPGHALIKNLAARAKGAAADDAGMADAAELLLDQARILEGEPVLDPIAFSKRLSTLMERGLTA